MFDTIGLFPRVSLESKRMYSEARSIGLSALGNIGLSVSCCLIRITDQARHLATGPLPAVFLPARLLPHGEDLI